MNTSLPTSHVLSAISHELRSPLASLKGTATLLLDYQSRLEPDKVASFLETIDRETDRMTEMVDDMIAFARIQIGVLRLHRESLPLTEVLDPLVVGPACQVVSQFIDVDPAAVLVNVDVRRIRIALAYLIQRLCVDGLTGTPHVLSMSVKGQRIVLQLPEAGALAALDRAARLLEKVESLEDPVLRRSGQAILHLLLSRAIVELHGGQLWFEAQSGSTSLYVALPRADLSEAE